MNFIETYKVDHDICDKIVNIFWKYKNHHVAGKSGDGGHLAFYAVEAVRGRPLGPKAQEYGFRFGLILVLVLFVFVTWNDVTFLLE